MGVREPPRREFKVHQRYVKGFGCCVPGCPHTNAVIDFHHVKSRGSGGGDWSGVSLCRVHHAEQHTMTVSRFNRKYGIDLWELAAEFTRTTKDQTLRAFLREQVTAAAHPAR